MLVFFLALWDCLIFLQQQIASIAQHQIPQEENLVEVEIVAIVESFRVFQSQERTKVVKVVVFEVPAVGHKIRSRFVGFVNFSRNFQNSEIVKQELSDIPIRIHAFFLQRLHIFDSHDNVYQNCRDDLICKCSDLADRLVQSYTARSHPNHVLHCQLFANCRDSNVKHLFNCYSISSSRSTVIDRK